MDFDLFASMSIGIGFGAIVYLIPALKRDWRLLRLLDCVVITALFSTAVDAVCAYVISSTGIATLFALTVMVPVYILTPRYVRN